MSIKYKIAFLFSSIVTLLFVLISLSVYFFSVTERNDFFKTRLKNRALSTARVYAGISDSNYAVLKRIDAAAVASLYEKSIIITGFNDTPVYMYADKPGDSLFLTKDIISETKINGEYSFTFHDKKAIALHHQDSSSNFVIAVASNDIDGKEYFFQLKRILLISLGLCVLFSFASGIFFAKTLVRPMSQITREVDLISSNNLLQRIKSTGSGDELTVLANTFNKLLDRLQESFSIQRRFISNASHELSTPLTSVSNQVDVALQKERSSKEYIQLLHSVKEDILHLQQLTHSLLDIAKAGSQGSIELSEIRIDEVLFNVVSDIQRQNQHFEIELIFDVIPEDEKMVTTFGNHNLLYMALKNLVENGCKYANDNKAAVKVSFNNSTIVITVFNTGDVIQGKDIENIFQPFFRTDDVQHKPGFGLGLPLCRQIILLHKGQITVDSGKNAGTSFTVQLPNIHSFH